MTYTCPKDPTHQSDDTDFCSICGAKITAGSALATPNNAPVASLNFAQPITAAARNGQICPDCGAERTPGAKFCEVCRYNFENGALGGLTAPAPSVATAIPAPLPSIMEALADFPDSHPLAAASPVATLPTAASVVNGRWEIIAVVDSSLYVDPDPAVPLPTDEPTRTFPLDFAENLIGRRSDRRDIHPEIPLRDPGVSHRHAKILREPDGSYSLLDVGSTNGTEINGQTVMVGVRTPLKEGDQITLGCWTRLTVEKLG